jgi:superfamily II DNA or RNA helicase
MEIHKGYLGQKGFSILKNSLSVKEQNEIRKDLTVKPFAPPNSMQKPTEFSIYRESPKKLYLPRFYGYKRFGMPKDIQISQGEDINIRFEGDLREYQTNIINTYIEEAHKSGCGLLEIPCGRGKTVMGLNIIAQLKKKTIVIVHKEFLLNQWVERINQFLPGSRIGRLQGQIVDIENKDIVIGMLQSLSMKDYPSGTFDSFGLAIVDEVHHISAEVFCRSLFKIVTPYMLGLSATMTRKDGLSKVFKLFLGDIVYKEEREADDNVLVKTIQYHNKDAEFSNVEYNFKGQTHYSKMISKLCNFNHRTEFILDIIKDTLDANPKHQIMVLAHFKSILTYLYDAIEHRNIATVGYYVGGMKEKALKLTESKQVVIATYAMAEEALDIKTLSCLIMATPKTDVTQAVGRILRVKHDEPLVIDIVDQHDIFKNQYIKRRRFYVKCGYKIIQSNIDNYKFNSWETVYEPKGKQCKIKTQLDKMISGEKDKLLQGKCFLKKPKDYKF